MRCNKNIPRIEYNYWVDWCLIATDSLSTTKTCRSLYLYSVWNFKFTAILLFMVHPRSPSIRSKSVQRHIIAITRLNFMGDSGNCICLAAVEGMAGSIQPRKCLPCQWSKLRENLPEFYNFSQRHFDNKKRRLMTGEPKMHCWASIIRDDGALSWPSSDTLRQLPREEAE